MTNSIIISNSKIRRTEDGRFSAFDIIRIAGGQKNPHQVWKRLCEEYPEVISSVTSHKFKGPGERSTPVADFDAAIYIMGKMPKLPQSLGVADLIDALTELAQGDPITLESIGKRIRSRGKILTESIVSDMLAKETGGTREVRCASGFVDVLTDSEVIEVKRVQSWKSAVGQSIVYCIDLPGRTPRIHLYGKTDQNQKRLIEKYCSALGVRVSYYSPKLETELLRPDKAARILNKGQMEIPV